MKTEDKYELYRRQIETGDTMVCGKCGKTISSEEYIVNCGWCEKCLDDDYNEYLKSKERKYSFLIETVSNNEYCMETEKTEKFEVKASFDIEAWNSLIEHCLENDCRKFKVINLEIL